MDLGQFSECISDKELTYAVVHIDSLSNEAKFVSMGLCVPKECKEE